MPELIVNTETDFTPSALVEFLNKKYGTKKGGSQFTFQDIQQYMRRGYLPKAYGHHPLCWIEQKSVGIKFIRVSFDKTQEE